MSYLGQGFSFRPIPVGMDFRDWLKVDLKGTPPLYHSPACQRNSFSSSSHWLINTILWDPGVWEVISIQAVHLKSFAWTAPLFGAWEHTGQVVRKGGTSGQGRCCSLEQTPQLSTAVAFIPWSHRPLPFLKLKSCYQIIPLAARPSS